MARAKVDLILSGIRELKRDPAIVAMMTAKGYAMLAAAQSSAPVDTGAYKAGLKVEVDMHTISGAVVHLMGTDPKSLSVESRTGNLARALSGAGGASPKQNYTTKSGKKRKATQAQIDNWTRGSRS